MLTKRIILAIAALLAFGGRAGAQEANGDDVGHRLINAFLSDVVTMSGRFEQQLVDADGEVIDKSSGILDIRRPGQFRWSYEEPYRQLLVADGLNIWSYDVDIEQVTVKDQDKTLGSTPAILLGGSADVLDDFDYIGSFPDQDTMWIQLQPKNTDNGFNRVELGFTDEQLSRMLFVDNLQQTTLIALFDVRFNAPIDDETFDFVPPSGVDVVGEPIRSKPVK